MLGHRFSKYDPRQQGKSKFEQLLDLFMQLLTYTSGDVNEAMNWLTQLDKEYQLTDEEYGIGDFIQELKDKGYIDENRQNGEIKITRKRNRESGRKVWMKFWETEKTKSGNHTTFKPGLGEDINPETRPFQFGDMLEQIDFTSSIRNAQINHGIEQFTLQRMTWTSGKWISKLRPQRY
jgi:uncharacterized protein with von Willebrand factor type A (vWA) domain